MTFRIVQSRLFNPGGDRSERRYHFICMAGLTKFLAPTPHNVLLRLRRFPQLPSSVSPSKIGDRLPPFVTTDGTDVVEWLRENLTGKCEASVFRMPFEELTNHGFQVGHLVVVGVAPMTAPLPVIMALNFSSATDAVHCKLSLT